MTLHYRSFTGCSPVVCGKRIAQDTHIVLKVIDTVDQEVTNKIIRATNRQTEVKDEAFESLKPFHRNLEEFYKAMSRSVIPPIYYEKRSKEYLGNPKVQPWQVITLAAQIKAYVSRVLEQPQSTHRYFGELLESNKDRLFNSTDELRKYYLSALIINRL
ncbi:MAG: AIPR family protein [Hormoscilla sp. GM102CHS1]|nr:AIPR family protein [Hormoscilla sp. GM102CHS1]